MSGDMEYEAMRIAFERQLDAKLDEFKSEFILPLQEQCNSMRRVMVYDRISFLSHLLEYYATATLGFGEAECGKVKFELESCI